MIGGELETRPLEVLLPLMFDVDLSTVGLRKVDA